MIPGSRFNTTDDEPWIEPLCETIRAAHASGKALFGICFGHQAIARALGGVAGAAPPYNFTVDEIELDAPASKLLGGRSSLRLYKSHGQQVLQAPPGAAVIARSARTPVEMYTVGGNVFCCQGHPEFVSKQPSTAVLAVLAMLALAPACLTLVSVRRLADEDGNGCDSRHDDRAQHIGRE